MQQKQLTMRKIKCFHWHMSRFNHSRIKHFATSAEINFMMTMIVMLIAMIKSLTLERFLVMLQDLTILMMMMMMMMMMMIMITVMIVMMRNLESKSFIVILQDLMMLTVISMIMMITMMRSLMSESFMVILQDLMMLIIMVMSNLMAWDMLVSMKINKGSLITVNIQVSTGGYTQYLQFKIQGTTKILVVFYIVANCDYTL